jgi:hypothetical protein
MIRVLRSVAVGVAAAALLLQILDLDGVLPMWLLPVALPVAILLSVLVSIVKGFGGSAHVAAGDLEAAEREGRISLAKVLDTRATGSSVNDQPICEIRVIVAPRTRQPYETTIRTLVNLGRLPSLQRGAVVVVAQPTADRPEVALLDPAPETWQRLADQDTQVRAIEQAPAWEAAPLPGRDKRGLLRIPAFVLLIVLVAAFVATLWPAREPLLAVARGTSLTDARAQLELDQDNAASIFPADRTPGVIDDLLTAAGGDQVTDLAIYKTYAYANAPTTPGAETTDEYWWRDGSVEHRGASSIQPDPGEAAAMLFDASTIDWSLIGGLVEQSSQALGISTDSGPYVSVERPESLADGDWVYGDVQIRVYLSDDYTNGYVTFDTAGQVLDVNGQPQG